MKFQSQIPPHCAIELIGKTVIVAAKWLKI
jgi:hypothetical protein